MKVSRSKTMLVIVLALIILGVLVTVYLLSHDEGKYKDTMVTQLPKLSSNDMGVEIDPIWKTADIGEQMPREPYPERDEVYEGMTMDELAEQINKSLASNLTGKGYLYASYSLEKGVDPFLAVAISLEETGCTWGCSYLVRACNNVGGMKGSGCGSYGAFPTLDDGIRAFIDNIARNYVAYGLTTADTMNPKYAENPKWASNVNAYIERIRNK